MFATSGERRYFVRLLSELEERFGVEVHSYCLMGNHFHLLVRSNEGSLSEAMQYLSANFTRHVNHWRNVDGPIFRGRFHSVSVTAPEHLQVLVRYIHRNPLDVLPAERLERYPWSSLPALLGHRSAPAWLHRRTVLDWFGGDARHLADFVVGDDHHVDEPDWIEDLRRRSTVEIGEGISYVEEGESPAAPEILVSLEAALRRFGAVDSRGLRRNRPGARNTARLALTLVARDDHGIAVSDLAAFCGVTDSYVRSAATRARSRYRDDPQFREVVHSLRLDTAA